MRYSIVSTASGTTSSTNSLGFSNAERLSGFDFCTYAPTSFAHLNLQGAIACPLFSGRMAVALSSESTEESVTQYSRRLFGDLALELAAFSWLVGSIALLWRNNMLLSAIVLVECLIAFLLWHERRDVSFFFILAVFGTLAEAVFVRFGVWRYVNPTIAGIPLWFPLAFGTAGLSGQRLAHTVTQMWNRAFPQPDAREHQRSG
jgi:hypothetical protein